MPLAVIFNWVLRPECFVQNNRNYFVKGEVEKSYYLAIFIIKKIARAALEVCGREVVCYEYAPREMKLL